MNNKANEIELDMQAYCRNTIQPNYSCRPKMINGMKNARGDYCHIDNNPIKTVSKSNPSFNNIVDFNLPEGGCRRVHIKQ